MPCNPQKARIMLKEGKAKVVKMIPFTIPLLYGSSGYKQEVSLGIDTGAQHLGVSATTEQTVLFEAEVLPRNDIQKLLATRRQYRHARRNRKTRYRKARYLNKKKAQGWLAPSVQHKIACHINSIRLVHQILPVHRTTIEVAQFDMQKLRNPEIEGKQYQQGPQLGFWNVREYVLARDSHTCQWCQGKSKDPILNVHHIESRKTGGDSPDNLITLCETCHDLIHRTQQEDKIHRKNRSFRDTTHMGIMRQRIYSRAKAMFQDVHLTYGYITKHTRITNNLEKSHLIDARCSSQHPLAVSDGTWYQIKYVRRNNRQIHKATIRKGGKRQRNIAPKYVHGFRLFDCVKYQGTFCFVFGRRSSGYFDLRTLDGTKIHASASYKHLKRVQKASAHLIERRCGISSIP